MNTKLDYEIPDRFYIENHVRLMIENPEPAHKRATELAAVTNRTHVGRIHIAEVIPLPPGIERRRKWCVAKGWILHTICAVLWLGSVVWALDHSVPGGSLFQSWAFFWRLALAGFFAFAHYIASQVFSEACWWPLQQQITEFRMRCERVIEEMSHEFN